MQYLVQLPTKYTKPCWHYSLQLKLFWVRKRDQWKLQVPEYEPPVCVRMDTNILETKKGTICFTCCSPEAPAKEGSSLTLWRLQLSSGPLGTENLPVCLLCDLFFYRQLQLRSIMSGDWNTPCHWTSACVEKMLTVTWEKNTKYLSLKSTEHF